LGGFLLIALSEMAVIDNEGLIMGFIEMQRTIAYVSIL